MVPKPKFFAQRSKKLYTFAMESESPSNVNPPSHPHESDPLILERVSFAWLLSISLLCILAILGLFSGRLVLATATIAFSGVIISLWKLRPSAALVSFGGIVFLFAMLSTSLSAPTIFSGRDQGSYANAAIRLSTGGSLESQSLIAHTFFEYYGAGKALNFPGFFYSPDGSLISQFPLGYTVWLSGNFTLFGLAGLSIANAFTLFLSLVTILVLVRQSLPLPFALGSVVAASLSFPFLWISENTLSENLAMPLFLILNFFLFRFIQHPNAFRFFAGALSATLLSLTRIEGFAIAPIAFLVPFFFPGSRVFLLKRFASLFVPCAAFFALSMTIGVLNTLPFYRTIGKALLDSYSDMQVLENQMSGISSSSASSFLRNIELFWTYGLIPVLVAAIFGLAALFQSKRYNAILPFFLAFPTFLYLFGSHISPDHPWELRRFIPFFWTPAILFAAFGISSIFEKYRLHFPGISVRPFVFSGAFSLLLVLPMLPSTFAVLTDSENPHLLEDTREISRSFSEKDLVLVDRLASGDPFSMISDPLNTIFGKSAVYFFNPEDLSRIDLSPFNQIFFIAQSEDTPAYKFLSKNFSLTKVKGYTLRTSGISHETNPLSLPRRIGQTAQGSIFLVRPL